MRISLLLPPMFLALQAPLTLERKAEIFTYDLEARFRIEGQVAPKLRVATGSYNMPDNCYMTGIYLGTEALGLAVTRDPGALANVEGALAARERNGRQIVDAAGKVTTWGRYDRDYVVNREPMNALLWLQHLAVARQVT